VFPRIEIVDHLSVARAEIELALNSESVNARISVVIFFEDLTCSPGSRQSFLEETKRFSYAFYYHSRRLFLLRPTKSGDR
jgi:hypothetical protein